MATERQLAGLVTLGVFALVGLLAAFRNALVSLVPSRPTVVAVSQSSHPRLCRESSARPVPPGKEIDAAPYRGPRPLFAVLAGSTWTGWNPRVALYADGTVLYGVTHGYDTDYFEARLPDEQVTALARRWVANAGFRSLCDDYELMTGGDLPSVAIYSWVPGAEKTVNVYGFFPGGPRSPAFTQMQGLGFPESDALPDAINAIYSSAASFSVPGAQPWVPDYLRLTLVSYDYAPDGPPLQWPSEWPDLVDPLTVKQEGSMGRPEYQVFAPGVFEDDIKAFLKKRRERQAIAVDGEKWAVYVRKVFPSEPNWTARDRRVYHP